jgi:S-adenosylmethionine-dependent methyltransferase
MAEQPEEKARLIAEMENAPASRVQHQVTLRQLLFHLQDLARLQDEPLEVLDAGCWTAEVSLQLTGQGYRVTVLEPSSCLLQEVEERAQRELPAGCPGLSFLNQRIEDLEGCQDERFDLVLCHQTVEYLDDPLRAMEIITRILRPRGLLSLVFRNRYGEAAYAALAERDAAAALAALEATDFSSGFGDKPGRLYAPEELARLLEPLGYTFIGEYGLRVFADYLSGEGGRQDALIELEERVGKEPAFRQAGRLVHLVARKD